MKDRKMKGLSPQPERAVEFDSIINMSDANHDKCTNSDWFIMDGGKARLKTAAELKVRDDKVIKDSAKAELKQARDEALMACTVEVNGNVYQANEDSVIRVQTVLSKLEAGEMYEWHMEDDEPISVPKEDLETAFSLGIDAVMKIRADFTEAWKAL